jgi:polar amino acid transport system permease protein
MIWQGFVLTVQISAISIFFALLLGAMITVMRLSRVKVLEWFSIAYIEFIRNTPLLVQLFFWHFGSYYMFPAWFNTWKNHLSSPEFMDGVIALSVYTSGFIAEDLRSGVYSIPKNQLEASRACGLSFLQAMRYVILPQAFRIVIPPLISQCLNLIKNSSLCLVISVAELTYMAKQVQVRGAHGFEVFTVSTLIYLAISLLVSYGVTTYNKHFLRTIKY